MKASSKVEVLIRIATVEDCPVMMDLIRELAAFEKEPNAVSVSLSDFQDAGFGKSPVWKAYVAVKVAGGTQGEIVGMALYYVRYSTWKGKMLYLEDIIVRQHFREMGIGAKLFHQLILVAQKEHFSGLTWQVLDWNESGLSFYKKMTGTEFDNSWINVKLML